MMNFCHIFFFTTEDIENTEVTRSSGRCAFAPSWQKKILMHVWRLLI
jgi:hypothetical protein